MVTIKASTFSKDESYQLIFQTTTPMKGDPVRYVMRQRYMFGTRPENPSADTKLDVVELECFIMELGPTTGSIAKYKAEALENQAASDSFNTDSDGPM